MKKYMKKAVLAMSIVMAVGTITVSTALGAEDVKEPSIVDVPQEVKNNQLFTEFEGKFSEVVLNTLESIIRVENSDGMMIDFVIGKNTILTDANGIIEVKDLVKGDKIKVYYVMPEIMTLQYPMKVTASIAVKTDESNPGDVFVGMLDENNLATDGSLVVHVNEDSIILDSEGHVYEGELKDNVVMVYYKIQTMSLPPQTNPEKIVVLGDIETELDAEGLPNQEIPQDYIDSSDIPNMTFFVNKEFIKDASAYVKDDITMVPLRSLCEAMGYDVNWDDVSKSVRIGAAITLKVGVNEYTIGKAMPQTLTAAPEIVEGKTFVPIDFLTEMLGAQYRIDEGIFDISLEITE